MEAKYTIIDILTQCVVGRYKTKERARKRRDQLDRQYGSVRYVVRAIQ